MDDACNNAGPTGLMACAQSRPIVSVEVFVEENVIAPVRVGLELVGAAVNRPPAVLISQKDIRETAADLLSHAVERHLPARPGGALDRKTVTVVGVVLEQRPDDQTVHRQPNRTAPIRVAAEHAGGGLCR